MSLFNEMQGEVIKKPHNTGTYHKELEKKKEQEEVKTEKELRKEMRAKLGDKEYKKRYRKHHYELNRDERKIWQKNRNEWLGGIMTEVIAELWGDNQEPVDYDKLYAEKFKDDDTVAGEYRFSWWSSRLKRIPRRKLPRQHLPFRIVRRNGLDQMISRLGRTQLETYKFLLPHFEEIKNCPISLQKRQQPYRYPMYSVGEPLNSLAEESKINKGHIVMVADGMIRGKYMAEEVYLGRNSFIFGDVVVSGTGHLFRIALENNLKWLTPKNVERIHKERMAWRKEKAEKQPPIYLVGDAYLIKIPVNERENLYYIVPT